MMEYLFDFTSIDTSNTVDLAHAIYEGKNAISFTRKDDWTSLSETDLSIDLWLCKITPPATLSADVELDTSDPSVLSLEYLVNSFSLTAHSSCGTLVYEV